MSPGQIEQKVEEYLRNSQLLAEQWRRPITSSQLQTEMERMASHSRQPDVLRELFAALGNDPFIVAECLARPILSERLVSEPHARANPMAETQSPGSGGRNGNRTFCDDRATALRLLPPRDSTLIG